MFTATAVEPSNIFGLTGEVTPTQRAAIQDFLRRRRITDDDEFHAFAKRMGVSPHDAEPVAYQMAHDLAKKTGLGQTEASKRATRATLYAGIGLFLAWATGMGLLFAYAQRSARRRHESGESLGLGRTHINQPIYAPAQHPPGTRQKTKPAHD